VILATLMFLQGLIINHFAGMDPTELRNLGWCKRVLGTYCKLSPMVIKIVHLVKFVLVLIITFILIFTKIGTKYNPDPSITAYDIDCSDDTRFNTTIRKSYVTQIKIFHSIEGVSSILSMFVLCVIKTVLDINAFIYQPYDRNASRVKKLLLRHLGP
jgi:hypothetical protein